MEPLIGADVPINWQSVAMSEKSYETCSIVERRFCIPAGGALAEEDAQRTA